MNYRQLEAFRALMEAGTVTAASQSLSISQPSLSAHIANLEHDLKLSLFQRKGGRLVPTPESRMLLGEVDELIRNMGRLRRLAADVRGLQAGKLTIAAYPSISGMLPKLAARFSTRHEGVNFALRVHDSIRNAELAATRQIDMGLTAMPVSDASLLCELISRVPSVCILPKDHPLTAKASVAPSDLRGEAVIMLGREDGSRQLVERVFNLLGIDVNTRFEANRSETACGMVAEGMGISIVDPFSARAWREHIAIRPFEADVPCDVYMVRSRNEEPSLLLSAFVDDLRAELAGAHGRAE